MIFVDTNYFVRFFLNDIPSQVSKVDKLFNKASEGKVLLFSSTIVFFEVYWVFLKYYGKTKKEVTEILKGLMRLKFIYFDEKNILLKAINIFEDTTSLELEDCYNIVYAKENGSKDFNTFDRKLNSYLKKNK